MSIKVLSVNISREKGTIKTPVNEIDITTNGVAGDAHAGDWHRQVSLLGCRKRGKMECAGRS
jgi:hypothetical protein